MRGFEGLWYQHTFFPSRHGFFAAFKSDAHARDRFARKPVFFSVALLFDLVEGQLGALVQFER